MEDGSSEPKRGIHGSRSPHPVHGRCRRRCNPPPSFHQPLDQPHDKDEHDDGFNQVSPLPLHIPPPPPKSKGRKKTGGGAPVNIFEILSNFEQNT